MTVDPNVKGAKSESFDKSHLSESVDVPAGCYYCSMIICKNSRMKVNFLFKSSEIENLYHLSYTHTERQAAQSHWNTL